MKAFKLIKYSTSDGLLKQIGRRLLPVCLGISILLLMCRTVRAQAVTGSMIYTIYELPANKENIPVTLVAYKGNEEQVIATGAIPAGTNSCRLTWDKKLHAGIADIRVGNRVSSIVVDNVRNDYRIIDSFSRLSLNKPTRFNRDQEALAIFKESYALMLDETSAAQQMIRSLIQREEQKKARENTLLFLKQFYRARMKMNRSVGEIVYRFPGTFLANTLPGFMYFPNLGSEDTLNYAFIHSQYFSRWKFNNSDMLYTPMVTYEVSNYLSLFGAANGSTTWYDGLDVFYKAVTAANNEETQDFFTDFLIVQLMQSGNPAAEGYMQYIYQHYVAGCTEHATNNHFIRSLANMDAVKVGRRLPDIAITNTTDQVVRLSNYLGGEYTLVFLWKPRCPYCEELQPQLKALAQKHHGKLNVFAVSMDNSKEEWLAAIKKQQQISNWMDVSEHKGFESPALAQYYYKGTPTIFLADKNGTIISRSTDIQTIENLIQ